MITFTTHCRFALPKMACTFWLLQNIPRTRIVSVPIVRIITLSLFQPRLDRVLLLTIRRRLTCIKANRFTARKFQASRRRCVTPASAILPPKPLIIGTPIMMSGLVATPLGVHGHIKEIFCDSLLDRRSALKPQPREAA